MDAGSPHDDSSSPAAAVAHQDARKAGFVFAGLATMSFLVCLGGFACKQIGLAIGAVSVALLAGGAMLSWLSAEARRMRDRERLAH